MLLFLLTAREGRLWAEPIWQGKISKVGCLFQNHAATAVVCAGTIAANYWLPLGPPELAPFYPAANSSPWRPAGIILNSSR